MRQVQKHVLVQGVYVGSASPLIADIKTQPYSMLTYMDDGMMTGTYDNTHDIPIYIDNGSTLNIMPTHFYDNAYYLHHLPKVPTAAKTIQTGNSPVKTHFWIDILLNVQGCMIQFKLLVCDTQAQTGILLSKMALEQLQTWQDYSNNTLYVKQTAIPLYAIQNIELLPDRKTTIEVIADRMNELQYKDLIEGQGIVWVWSNDSSKHIPKQQEIDTLLKNLRKWVLHNLMVKLDTKDLIESYTKSLRYREIYNYITDGRLPGNANTQKKIVGETANYVVVNGLLFKIAQHKESGKMDSSFTSSNP